VQTPSIKMKSSRPHPDGLVNPRACGRPPEARAHWARDPRVTGRYVATTA
jgi:hypothetical protein